MSGATAVPDPIIPDVRSRKLRSNELKTGLSPLHQHLLDQMLMNPTATRKQLARALGVTPQTIYNIVRSDAFQALWVERRTCLDAVYEMEVTTKIHSAMTKGLDTVIAALDDPEVSPEFALSVFEKTHRVKFGDPRYNGPQGSGPVQINVAIGQNDLSEARRLISIHAQSERPETATNLLEQLCDPSDL
jgi:DNA-binding MarR family transcriptional regulator